MKVRVTPELIAKAGKVFSEVKKGTIRTNEGLTRSELRALERKGIVRKMPTYGSRKYQDVSPSMSYIWELR